MSVNIILTGLMGGGKSTVGKLLVKQMTGYIFVDVDDVIVDLEGMSIPEIFEKKGEAYFREVEKNIISEFSEEENLVIALGGGAFEDEENRKKLLNSGIVFYLKAGVDTLYERIKNDTNRPLLQCENPKGKLEELLIKREPNYLKSHHTICTDNQSMEDVINNILYILDSD